MLRVGTRDSYIREYGLRSPSFPYNDRYAPSTCLLADTLLGAFWRSTALWQFSTDPSHPKLEKDRTDAQHRLLLFAARRISVGILGVLPELTSVSIRL
jgi:hypothetical protein